MLSNNKVTASKLTTPPSVNSMLRPLTNVGLLLNTVFAFMSATSSSVKSYLLLILDSNVSQSISSQSRMPTLKSLRKI
jgi:hypothetical protein